MQCPPSAKPCTNHMSCDECGCMWGHTRASPPLLLPLSLTHTHACICMHAIRAHTYKYTHACKNTCAHTFTHTHACMNMHACMRADTHEHVRAHARMQTHRHAHTCPHAHIHMHALTRMHTHEYRNAHAGIGKHPQAYKHTRTGTHTRVYARTRTHARIDTHAHARAQKHAHTHTHTRTHAQACTHLHVVPQRRGCGGPPALLHLGPAHTQRAPEVGPAPVHAGHARQLARAHDAQHSRITVHTQRGGRRECRVTW